MRELERSSSKPSVDEWINALSYAQMAFYVIH